MRSLALLLRGFSSSSALLGAAAFCGNLPRLFLPQTHTGNSGGHMHPSHREAKVCLTALSSSEWKVIIASLPPTLSESNISPIALSSPSSSPLT